MASSQTDVHGIQAGGLDGLGLVPFPLSRAEKKAVGQQSYRVAMQRQPLRRPNKVSMRLRSLLAKPGGEGMRSAFLVVSQSMPPEPNGN